MSEHEQRNNSGGGTAQAGAPGQGPAYAGPATGGGQEMPSAGQGMGGAGYAGAPSGFSGVPPGMQGGAAAGQCGMYGNVAPATPGYAGMYPGPGGYYYAPPMAGGAPGMGMPFGHAYAPMPGAMHAQAHAPGMGQGPGFNEFVQELASGGNGLSSLGKLLNFDDQEFWKGALVGAAAVLLLTNESVQSALFKGGVKAKDAVERGVDKLKTATRKDKSGSSGTAEDDEDE